MLICSWQFPVFSSRVPPPALVGVVARRPGPARDHRHSASQLLRLVVSGSTGGAGGRGVPGEVWWRAAPHGGQCTLWRSAAVSVRQDACWDWEGQWGGRGWWRRGVFDGGQAHESQAVLQPTGHGGVSEGRSYLLAGMTNETMDTWDDTEQETRGIMRN